jgi:tetratricopeptide (TPR) repeat protein
MRKNPGSRDQKGVLCVRACLLAMLSISVVPAQIARPLAEAIARNNQAVELTRAGRDTEAERLYRAALEESREDEIASARIATNLGELYRRQDRYRDAERMFHSALEWRRKNLPESNADLAYALNNLGEIYRVEGRDWEARNLMESAARSLELFHPDAPGLPVVLSNFAVVLCGFREFERAESSLRSALNAYDRLHQTSTPEYGVSLTALAGILQAQDRLLAAEPLYEQAIGIFEGVGPTARVNLAATLAGQGELYQRLERPDEAGQTEQRALQLLPPAGDALLRVQILRNLGNIAARGSKPADSVPYFQQSLSIQEKTLGADHPATAALLLDYASATQRAGDKSLARKLRKRAQELIERLSPQMPIPMTVSLRDLRNGK